MTVIGANMVTIKGYMVKHDFVHEVHSNLKFNIYRSSFPKKNGTFMLGAFVPTSEDGKEHIS